MLKKAMLNQVVKLVKSQLGVDDKYKYRKIENELRALRTHDARQDNRIKELEKDSHPKRNLIEKNGKYYLEEAKGE